MEAERCGEVKGPAQGRWKQKGGWVESQGKGDYLGQFFIPSFFVFIRAISIATEKES